MSARRAFAGVLLLLAAAPGRAAQDWVAPAAERERTNPVASSPETLQRGGELYKRYCLLCHGEKGKGDGPVSRMHAQRTSEPPRDLTQKANQARLTDGEIFWKLSSGLKRADQVIMPAFETEIPKAEDRWKLVHFIRSLRVEEK